jgi:MerR family transcriptional regulator, light-induced transcriptional regulator
MDYTIKYLETISGIKAHTIRIWEKRYKMLQPNRTSTNIRFYDDAHLKKILNVAALLDSGYKISKIAKLTDKQIGEEIKKCMDKAADAHDLSSFLVNELIISSLNFDKFHFEKTFNTGILKMGFHKTVEYVLFPTLKKIGVLWQSEEINPAQEHFFSSMVKQKLFSAIDGVPEPEHSLVKCVLYLPEDEDHEIGLLYFNYILLKGGIKTIYLGTRMPIQNIFESEKLIKPTHIIFFIIKLLPLDEVEKYIKSVAEYFPRQKIILCGNPEYYHSIKFPENVTYMPSPDAAKKYFKLPTL